jgi:hypothetical protein
LQDKLFARTAEGQRMRLSVLRGSVIAFVTAGYSGKRFIFEKCRWAPCAVAVLRFNPAACLDHMARLQPDHIGRLHTFLRRE